MDQAILEPPKRTGPFDPYVEAESRGYSLFGPVGRVGFGALQRSFSLACPRRSRFDGTRWRMRNHVCFYWEKGHVKNTIYEVYTQECASFVNGAVIEEEPVKPIYMPLTSATGPALQGSFNDGVPVLPGIMGTDFIVTPELTTLLGGDAENVATITNLMNEGLETGEIVVQRVKFAGKDQGVRQFYADHDISYNAKKGMLRYVASFTFWTGTRPMDRHTVARLWASGYFDRLNMVRPDFVNEEEKERQSRWRGPIQDWSRLRAYNDALWNSRWGRVSLAPDAMHDKVMDELYRLYRQYEASNGRVPGLRSMRDLTNVYQILAAYAIADTVKNDGKGPYEDVRYDLGCEERAIQALPDYVRSRLPPKAHDDPTG